MLNMTTLHIELGPLRFRGLSDVLFEEHLCKSIFLSGISGEHDSINLDHWLQAWHAAAELARLVELSLGISRDGIGH